MKKLILFSIALSLLIGFNACKKDNDNNNGTPSTTCKLKSLKEVITSNGNPTQYGGFVLYYDNADIINKAVFIDSTTGNEDSTSYALLSYSSDNLTDVKIFQQGQQVVNFSMTYSTQNKIEQRFFDINTPFGLAKISQTYFYDNNGNIEYSIRRTQIDNFPGIGKVINKDSARYLNYNSFGRPSGVVVYNSRTSNQGTQPYTYSEEIAYQYDAHGNRIKTSSKSAVNEPFEETYSATFDAEKTPGEAKEAYTLLTKLFNQDWDDPNLDSKDIDVNLKLSETNTDNGSSETTTFAYTFNDKGNPATSKETSQTEVKNSTYTYMCK